jgi:hypothetical protein
MMDGECIDCGEVGNWCRCDEDVIVVSSDGDKNEVWVWNSEVPFTTEMQASGASEYVVTCDGERVHHVLWCVTGRGGVGKRVVVDADGEAFTTDKGSIVTEMFRGTVKVEVKR